MGVEADPCGNALSASSRIAVNGRSRALIALAVAALVAIPAATAWACGPNRAVTLDKFSYSPGATVYVTGLNFPPGAHVTINVDGTAAATANVSDDGSFSTSFTAPRAAGTHVVTTEGTDQQGQPLPGTGNAVTFTVVAPSPGPADGGGRRSYIAPRPPPGTLAGCPLGGQLLSLTSASDNRNGTSGNDLIRAGSGDDTVDALAGDDCVDLGPGVDRGQGGAGDDLVRGGDGSDRVLGNDGDDRLSGGAGPDAVLGGTGNDTVYGQAGHDRVAGSRGRDRIDGGSGSDVLGGGSGKDTISGRRGSDRITGGSGDDVLKGNSGNDRINGAQGRDRVACGRGIDTVVADSRDVVAGDCERVRRRGEAVAGAQARGPSTGAEAPLILLVGFGAQFLLLGWPRSTGE